MKGARPDRTPARGGDARLRRRLETLYRRFNRREWAGTDPVLFVYEFDAEVDREVAGLVASSLAYGRVAQIQKSVRIVLDALGPAPASYLRARSARGITRDLRGFRHRFTTGGDVAALLVGMKRVLTRDASLGVPFARALEGSHGDVLPALERWVARLEVDRRAGAFALVPSPAQGSACKRLLLFVRWMSRRDEIDPGCWVGLAPEPAFLSSRLVVPVDVHMHRVGRALGFTRRAQADLETALEITAAFRSIERRDPVRYDFGLTRLDMSNGLEWLRPPVPRGCGPPRSS